MIRIAIVDDHAIVRQGLKQIVGEDAGMVVAGEAATAADALKLLRERAFDVLVLDISLPGQGGLDVLKDVRERGSPLPVLILSTHAEEIYALRALKAGAAGYLAKDTASDELVKAIRKVHAGGRYVSPALGERLAAELHAPAGGLPHERLTEREHQIMLLLGAGRRVSDIARALHLSVKTVSTHRARLLEKMGLEGNAALTHYVVRNGLLD